MLKIESIQNGIVIDHIPAGKGMDIYKPFYILLFFTVHIISTDVLLNMLIIYILYKAPHDTLHPQRPSLHPNNVCSSEEYS